MYGLLSLFLIANFVRHSVIMFDLARYVSGIVLPKYTWEGFRNIVVQLPGVQSFLIEFVFPKSRLITFMMFRYFHRND